MPGLAGRCECEEPSGIPETPAAIPSLHIDVLTVNEAFYLGERARVVPLVNGVQIEVQNGDGIWIPQITYTEE